jgi:hypothetical protein
MPRIEPAGGGFGAILTVTESGFPLEMNMSAMRNALIAAAILLPLSYTVADAQAGAGGFGRPSMGARSGGGGGGGGGGGAAIGRGGSGGFGGGGATFGRGGRGSEGVVGGGAGPWRGGYRGYRGYRGGYRSNVFIGFGGFYDPFFDPFWPYPYYYPYGYGFGYSYAYRPPQVVYAPPPEDYLLPPNAPPPDQIWYYCEDPSGYYPYVRSCNREWQAVPARPEGAPPANLSSNDPSGAGEGATN